MIAPQKINQTSNLPPHFTKTFVDLLFIVYNCILSTHSSLKSPILGKKEKINSVDYIGYSQIFFMDRNSLNITPVLVPAVKQDSIVSR